MIPYDFGVADTPYLEKLDAIEATLRGVFQARDYRRIDLPIIHDALVFVDHLGEEMRHRMFTFPGPSGEELCLRPEQTIPACQYWIGSGAKNVGRLHYIGSVFRLPTDDTHRRLHFRQMGAEIFGLADRKAGNTEMLKLSIEALRAVGLHDLDVKFGDLSLFSAFVDALDIPRQWRGRMKRHFLRTGYFKTLLSAMSRGATTGSQRLLAHLGTLDAAEGRPAFEGLVDMLGAAPQGARTREEIVDRLMEQAADAVALKLDPKVASLIVKLLSISGPVEKAHEKIRALTKSAGISLDRPLKAMEDRLATLKSLGVEADHVSFSVRFGRNLDYYTGFVFELWTRDAEGPVQVAGGGRYDTLLEQLGAKRSIPAIGVAIRTERVLAAQRKTPR